MVTSLKKVVKFGVFVFALFIFFYGNVVDADEEDVFLNISIPVTEANNSSPVQDFLNINISSNPNVEITKEISAGSAVIFVPKIDEAEIVVDFENLPNQELYFYIDSLDNAIQYFATESLSTTFVLNGYESHLIFIKTQPSTKIIRNDATGGDCSTFGIWNQTTLTCTLTEDIFEVIQIASDNITLDGNGKMVKWNHGFGVGSGITIAFRKNIIVKNLIVEGFDNGFGIFQTTNSQFFNNETRGFGIGFLLSFNDFDNIIEGNLVTNVHGYLPDLEISSTGILLSQNVQGTIVRNNTISVTHIGLAMSSTASNNKAYNNNFMSLPHISSTNTSINTIYQQLPLGGNYYRSYDTEEEGCFDVDNDFICDNAISFGNVTDNLPWIYKNGWQGERDPDGCTIDCFSNVLFLPGLMGSRLYNSNENELWVSSNDAKHSQLALDNQGKSIDSTIHTKNDTENINGESETGIVDEFPLSYLPDLNIYKSFIHNLRKWKNNENIITDYAFIPYDWRLSLDDIITNGNTYNSGRLSYNTSQDFSESFLVKKLAELQTSSKSGKVTIIAHSNGGLVAKALMQKLKNTNNPLYEKIDQIILVAVPQIGTPDAVASLLHGSALGYGLIMNKDRSRQLAENMPTIYNLLPSTSYFNTVDPGFAVDKLISFENKPFFVAQTSQYGVFVSNPIELKNYILGTDGRSKPAFTDTINPNIGNSSLYTKAEAVHQILDTWQPPSDTKVIQVAGWGEETLAGIDYKSINDATEHLSYKPRFVIDGDSTVVVPSALWMSTSNSNVERWWVDLKEYNKPILNINRKHRDIFEIPNLLNFIKSKIKNETTFNNPGNVILNTSSNLSSTRTRLHYTLHSPLTLGIVDSQGRYTGMDPATKKVKEEIPDVMYTQIGDVQFVSIPVGTTHTLKLAGYDNGYFALDIDKQEGNIITEQTSFQGIPTTHSTLVTVDISPSSGPASTTLKLDINGDGIDDFNINSKLNSTVNMPYVFSGFMQPINDTAHQIGQSQSVFKAGSTVPVKFQLKKYDGTITQAGTLPTWLDPQKEIAMSASVGEYVYTDTATSGNEFKWDPDNQQYVYNWKTKGLPAGYWYKISTQLDDGNIYSVTIGLK